MRIDYALLADLAQTTPDGKVSIIGGGIDFITAGKLPTVQNILSLVIRIEVSAAECGRVHHLEIFFWDPDGQSLPPTIEADFDPQRDAINPAGPSFIQLSVILQQIAIPREGDYGFRILIDGREEKILPLRVRLSPHAISTSG